MESQEEDHANNALMEWCDIFSFYIRIESNFI
jgi:hypothetical protein